MMLDNLGTLTQVLSLAADRLNGVGAFADESVELPSVAIIRTRLQEFETNLRSNGYNGGPIHVGDVDRPREGVSYIIFDSSRFPSCESAMAAWYADYSRRWHEIVESRVREWLERLDLLKDALEDWLPPEASMMARADAIMNEELMRKFGVQPARMPCFDVKFGPRRVLRFQPKGLWVIGANGRIDITTPVASYILVDKAEPMSGHSDWQYYASQNKQSPTPFNKQNFLNFLS